ncbi:outer membrane protein [Chelativorans intermedius]|uniref:Outer membrane protein n=1 Tax=Chelativorans intermedius TaxID=515947 RepID=A0ABV6DAK1_9HYPH|nr:outer membrane beta-barrel protein [Chelativorans intermedius]MCT8997947.1 outer membrane beta-barrel protein [Chelativorans intermedius]
MSKSLFFRHFSLAGAIGVLAMPMAAGAADYDLSIPLDAPQYVPVEVGSGWYLRGDVTYALNDSVYDVRLFGTEADNNRFGGSIGMGYHFTDMLRADVNLAYIGDDSFYHDDGVDFASAENRTLAAMVNGYVDLGTFVGITPYVGAGAGLLYSKQELRVNSPTLGVAYAETDRQYEFAYSLNAGVAYQLTRNVSVDVGYQYLSAPSAEYRDLASGAVKDGIDFHQLRVGLRYDLW